MLMLIPGSCLLKVHCGVFIKGLLDFSASRIPADYFHCGSTLLCVTTQEPQTPRNQAHYVFHYGFSFLKRSHI